MKTPIRKGAIFAQTNNLTDQVARLYSNVRKRKSKIQTPKRDLDQQVLFTTPPTWLLERPGGKEMVDRYWKYQEPKTPVFGSTYKGSYYPKGPRKHLPNYVNLRQKDRKKRSVALFVPEGTKKMWRMFRRPLGEDESKRRYPNASNVSGLMI